MLTDEPPPCVVCAGVLGDNVRCMAATVPGHRQRAARLAARIAADRARRQVASAR